MTTDVESFNRNAVPLDEKNTLNVVRDEPRDVPVSDILDEPLFCLKFNENWRPHITGAIDTLSSWKAWVGSEDDTNEGTIQIWKLLAQDMTDCGDGDCPDVLTIPEIIADDTYFETEYVPVIFGEYYSQTVTNETAKAALYDSTPQSIGANIPTSAPVNAQKTALCAAVSRFVSLYSSTKLCLIQSQSFLEIFWNDLAAAANEFYETATALMSPIYSPNIFSCFVDNGEAITALQDETAIESLACHLYDELKTVIMSQSNFDAAILDAATTLTGDAQKIACIMQNDNNLSLYINMLEAYQICLLSNETDCPCETSIYWRMFLNFNTGQRYGTVTRVINGSGNDGRWNGNGYVFNVGSPPPTTLNVALGMSLGGRYPIRAMATKEDRSGANGSGNDFIQYTWYANEGFADSQGLLYSIGGLGNGTDYLLGQLYPTNTNPSAGWQIFSRVDEPTNGTSPVLRIHQVVLWGIADINGDKPLYSAWAGSTLPSTVAGLFP